MANRILWGNYSPPMMKIGRRDRAGLYRDRLKTATRWAEGELVPVGQAGWLAPAHNIKTPGQGRNVSALSPNRRQIRHCAGSVCEW